MKWPVWYLGDRQFGIYHPLATLPASERSWQHRFQLPIAFAAFCLDVRILTAKNKRRHHESACVRIFFRRNRQPKKLTTGCSLLSTNIGLNSPFTLTTRLLSGRPLITNRKFKEAAQERAQEMPNVRQDRKQQSYRYNRHAGTRWLPCLLQWKDCPTSCTAR